MDKTQLTVFAPIDRSLSDLLGKVRGSQRSSINLVELAKHHIGKLSPSRAPFCVSLARRAPGQLNQRQTGSRDRWARRLCFGRRFESAQTARPGNR